LLITATQFILSASCNKNDTRPCVNFATAYSFKVTSEFAVQQETYNIGDTIFLSSNFPKTLTDYTTINNQQIDYSNSVGIYGDIGFAYLDSITHQIKPAKDSFAFVPFVGNFVERTSNQNQGINSKYAELSTTYKFYAGIICKKKKLLD